MSASNKAVYVVIWKQNIKTKFTLENLPTNYSHLLLNRTDILFIQSLIVKYLYYKNIIRYVQQKKKYIIYVYL